MPSRQGLLRYPDEAYVKVPRSSFVPLHILFFVNAACLYAQPACPAPLLASTNALRIFPSCDPQHTTNHVQYLLNVNSHHLMSLWCLHRTRVRV